MKNIFSIILALFVATTSLGTAFAGGNDTAEEVLKNSSAAQPINVDQVLDRSALPSLDYLPERANLVFKIKVDANGNYVSHKLQASDSPYMAQFIGRQLHKLKFKPAVQNGNSVPSWVVLPVVIN